MYHPSPDWRSRHRAQLGISPDRFVLGYVGRLVEEKGLDKLLLALDQLKQVPWELLLIGSGPFEAALRQKVDRMRDGHGRVHFIGYVSHDETSRWLSSLDVLVLPSQTRQNWKEQFGRVLLEAMACGTPVVGSSSGEIPNVINATGGGLIFPERDTHALAENLTLLAGSPELRRNLIDRGQRSVAELFDQRHLVRRFASVIEEVIASRSYVNTQYN
jgi:glycosyltransferase involved in cell wall biosynthesis